MELTLEMRTKINNLINDCINKATELYPELANIEFPNVDYSLRGHTAGKAMWKRDKHNGNFEFTIRINRDLLLNEKYHDEMMNNTIIHETAHTIIQYVYLTLRENKVSPHGKEWKRVMIHLGIEPNRTHNMKTASARTYERFMYGCECTTHKVTKNRHVKMQRGNHLRCNKCKIRLVFIEKCAERS